MKKKSLIFLLVLLLIIVIIFIVFIVADQFNIINLRKNSNLQNLNSGNVSNESKIDFETKKTDFTLIDQNGNKVSLSNYRGKKVVILYWAVWCPPCKEEVPIINELSKEYNDAIFLTIVSPTLGENSEYKTYQEEIAAYIQKNNIEVPVLIDEGKKCLDIYGIERYPCTIFVDEYGDIREKVGSKEKSGKLTKEEIIKKLEEY
ncbi:MAG: TlpA disulfide reductase family protein [Clostridia bacterium]|jgi:putative cytochrome C-type biogenesis protein